MIDVNYYFKESHAKFDSLHFLILIYSELAQKAVKFIYSCYRQFSFNFK